MTTPHRKLVDFNLWLMLGALVSVLAWLAPDKVDPWRSFDSEWLFAASLIPLAVWVGTRPTIRSISIPTPALAILAAAVVPLIQGLVGQIQFGGDAALAILYLVGSSMAIGLGHVWRSLAPASVSIGVPLTILFSALISLCLATMQWLHVDVLGVLLMALPPHARPTGNIGQANHLGTLLAGGLLAIWWLYEKRRLGPGLASAAALLLLFGIAMTQSRTGWLNVSFVAIAALVLRQRFGLRIHWRATLAFGAAFAALVLGWEFVNASLQITVPLTLEQQVSTGPRLKIWQQFAAAVAAAPWFGYGWTQGGLAQQAVVLGLLPLNIVIGHAHNLVLDLFVWQGIPLTAVMLAASAYWTWLRVRRIKEVETLLCALALLLVLTHSMVEFPHAYSYFLLPCALLIGIIEADCGYEQNFKLPRKVWVASVGVLSAVLIWLGGEYLMLKDSLQLYRFESARIGNAATGGVPNALMLTQLTALMVFIRTPLDSLQSDQQLTAAASVVARFPSAANQFRLASLWAHNGRPELASKSMRMLCTIQTVATCRHAIEAWNLRSEASPQLKSVALPPLDTSLK